MRKWFVVLWLVVLPSCGSSQLSVFSTPNVSTTNMYMALPPPARPPPVTKAKTTKVIITPTGERSNERTKPPAR